MHETIHVFVKNLQTSVEMKDTVVKPKLKNDLLSVVQNGTST